jgi:hypothetical protein
MFILQIINIGIVIPIGTFFLTITPGAGYAQSFEDGGIRTIETREENIDPDNEIIDLQVDATAIKRNSTHSQSYLETTQSGMVTAWGSAWLAAVPNQPVVNFSLHSLHALAILPDSTVLAWGGTTTVPPGLSNVVGVAAGSGHSMALLVNGTVIAWGDNSQDEATVPAGLSNVKAIAAGTQFSLALLENGTVVQWGRNVGELINDVPFPVGLSNIVAISAGVRHGLALRANGTVAAWGWDNEGQATVPVGLSNVVAISAGRFHSLALRADGTVVAWGSDFFGQSTVPAGLSNVIAIAAGFDHSLALRENGTVVAWGTNANGETNIPSGLSNVISIEAGWGSSLAITSGQGNFNITAPSNNEIVQPGESYTIKFTAPDDIELINLYTVRTFTNTGPRTLIAENIPAVSGEFAWEVPEDFLSPSTFIIAVDTDDQDREAASDRFRVRDPWRLYRQTGTPSEPEYEQFRLAEHSFSFSQDDENVWPQLYWDRPYHYYNNMTVGYDPFVGTNVRYDVEWFDVTSASTHPPWPAVVRAFDTYGTYASLEPWVTGEQLLHRPNPEAAGWWSFYVEDFNGEFLGICYGVSMAVLAAFQDPERFDAVWLPGGGSRNLSQLQPTDEVLDAVHALFMYQFGRLQTREYAINRAGTTPRQTLARLKGMFESDVRDLDRLLIFESYLNELDKEGNQKYGVHAVVPLGMIDHGDGLYEIGVFDPNYDPPGSGGDENPGFVYIDSTANSWSVDNERWVGATGEGIYMSIEAIYAFDPASTRWPHVFEEEQASKVSAQNNDEPDTYQIGITGSGGAVVTGSGELRFENGALTETMQQGYIAFPLTGRASKPYAYIVPAGTQYLVEAVPDEDGRAGIRIENHLNTSELRQRGADSQSHTKAEMVDNGFMVMEGGNGEFDLSLMVRNGNNEIRTIRTNNLTQTDPAGLGINLTDNNYHLIGSGSESTYNLMLSRTSYAERRVFYHSGISFSPGSVHVFRPDWETLGESTVTIEIDLNGDGEIDETLVLENQGIPVSVEQDFRTEIPVSFTLHQNYPNPFNPSTVIGYDIPASGDILLEVYDMLGRRVTTLVNEYKEAGRHTVMFNAGTLSSGVYLYRIKAGEYTTLRRMTLLK